MTLHRLEPLLNPASIAVVGASGNAARIGGMPLAHLTKFGYRGAIYPINPKYEEVFGLRCWPDLEALPAAPDLVVLALAAAEVTPMLKRCQARGVRAVIVYAAGFAEAGDAGAALQAELEAFVATTDMVVAGPNAMGFANLNTQAHTNFASVFNTAPMQQGPGRVSLLTQSGNVCAAVYAIARRLGVDFSHFINTGNEACVDFAQYLEYLAQDDATDLGIGYIEELRDGPRFMEAAAEFVRRDKLLILYKAGETEKGSEAVRSHTSALAGDQQIYQAAFRQLNIIQSHDFAQMAQLAHLAGYRHRSAGKRVAIITISGALGAILADKFIGQGLDVPTLPQPLQDQLHAGIPDYGMVSNPVDVTGNVVNDPGFVRTAMEALAVSDAIDAIVVYAPGYMLDRMADDLCAVAEKHPRLIVAIDTGAAKTRDQLRAGGVPVFEDIGVAVSALSPFLLWQERRKHNPWLQVRSQPAPARATLAGRADEHTTKRYLAEFGVQPVDEAVARTADEAAAVAERLGFPVVLKVLSADIAHKTEAGGVRLRLGNAKEVRKAFDEVMASARAYAPTAQIDGALLQKMEAGQVELILGATRDPVFGMTLTVGLGGVLTELYKDVSHRVLPVDEAMARDMLGELKAFPLLTGYRGRPLGDVEAACRAIAGFSRAVLALQEQADEVEVNPLLVKEQGQGVRALDALVLAS
ncbi:acyl-CoA synthetase (NDP forming) [Variovorax boronicumulans]|uniref:Acyl-CoA synthetase (NDP forming) n=1 Tax=Variovorax boronicumulans TaxID=436515 RepID=A0AAW8DVL9_9BURK|nr:acetate--CoA ligase family protein [Variovorax boronicumulans]MDP9878647.1 acyl-CoA synthetase (NDP forming) [Variovorax boronicumulans]MDP9923349.1 acyl-CoA synthetase (NDP forming) [Variovorax boronicumulans]